MTVVNCPKCGFWNAAEREFCARCGDPLPLLVEDEAEPPPEEPKPPKPKVKSEVLRLFDPATQRTRKGPGGTKLIRRPKRGPDERPAAVPGDSGAPAAPRAGAPPGARPADPNAAPPAAGEPTRRRGRTSRRLTLCSVCEAPFASRDLLELRGKRYCTACLDRRASMFEADEVDAARRERAERVAESEARAAAEAPPPPVRPVPAPRTATMARPPASVTTTATRNLGGRTCARHPDHTASDRCEGCGTPLCALCIQRVGTRVLCPGCRTGTDATAVSGRYEGFGGSGLETTRDVLVHPSIFFRSLPAGGSLLRPFLHAAIASFVGALLLFAVLALWAGMRGSEGQPLAVLFERPWEFTMGALLCSVASPTVVMLGHLLGAATTGGRATAWHSARGSLFTTSTAWLTLIPGAGLALWPLWWFYAQATMLRLVQGLEWGAALGVALLTTLAAAGLHLGLAQVVVF